eukprot:TRINITY_DN32103_c0_g1_i1.p1 TRINITY_DN32103_c0_g1~~TRINITY_DN32103_c0_g1_i1.p1  ORF type:complete len:194 (-),score=25.91 TRINITY_DN32103_c0_g1_i1:389-970(-)
MLRSGSVKWFDEDKGFGFITPARRRICVKTPPSSIRNDDVFVHASQVAKKVGYATLCQGERVTFFIVVDQRKQKSKAVKVIGDPFVIQNIPQKRDRNSWQSRLGRFNRAHGIRLHLKTVHGGHFRPCKKCNKVPEMGTKYYSCGGPGYYDKLCEECIMADVEKFEKLQEEARRSQATGTTPQAHRETSSQGLP